MKLMKNVYNKYDVSNGLPNTLLIASLVFLLSSCSSFRGPAYQLSTEDEKTFQKPLRAPKEIKVDQQVLIEEGERSEIQTTLKVQSTPTLSVKQRAEVANNIVMPQLNVSTKISRLSFNNMSVSTFINEVFGNQLGLSFVIEPKVANAKDLVTMRLASALNQPALYKVATQTLASYGVTSFLKDNILVFAYSEEASQGDTPLFVSGRTLPEVPDSSRPLFYVFPLKALQAVTVQSHLSQLFKSNELNINIDVFSNSLVFLGSRNKIQQAIAATELFDQPEMSGMYSRIITPAYSNVKDLATNLESVLKTEGFAVGIGANPGVAVRILPLESTGQMIVFAKSQQVLQHILKWANSLEIEKQSDIQQGLFTYQVQSTLASHIVSTLNNLGVANVVGVNTESDSRENASISGNSSSQNSTSTNRSSINNENARGRYTVDEQLNTILFSGKGKDWLQVLPVIKKLDKPAPSVLVEVILVEVTLNDKEESGIEWLANASLGKYDATFGTLGGFLNPESFNFFGLNSAGQTRLVLNALYNNTNSTIRSRPRIMVKSGEEASIDVGNEIPVITQSSQSTTNSDAQILQNISYRKTGVILDIKPTVHAAGFVDIAISQELSQALPGLSNGNPTILNRTIQTTVTLKDGGSVLIGGLISSGTSDVERGIPILGKLPFIGKLFRTDLIEQDRTELMVMIIPYILNSPEEAEALTDELQEERIQSLSNSN